MSMNVFIDVFPHSCTPRRLTLVSMASINYVPIRSRLLLAWLVLIKTLPAL